MVATENEIIEHLGYKQFLWLHYLHDISCIWTNGLEKLKEFRQSLDNFQKTIKFTINYTYKIVKLLDALLLKHEDNN